MRSIKRRLILVALLGFAVSLVMVCFLWMPKEHGFRFQNMFYRIEILSFSNEYSIMTVNGLSSPWPSSGQCQSTESFDPLFHSLDAMASFDSVSRRLLLVLIFLVLSIIFVIPALVRIDFPSQYNKNERIGVAATTVSLQVLTACILVAFLVYKSNRCHHGLFGCILMIPALLIVIWYLMNCPNFPPLDPGGLYCNFDISNTLLVAVAFPCNFIAALLMCPCCCFSRHDEEVTLGNPEAK